MSSINRTINNLISSNMLLGSWRGFAFGRISATTATATTSCGYISCQRIATQVTIPSNLPSGCNGVYFTKLDSYGNRTSVHYNIVAEYELSSLAISGNVSSGNDVTIPSREVMGETVDPVGQMFFLVSTVALTATAPVITITYTNQNGTGSRTATLTLPNSPAINSAFHVNPHLQAGDTGIKSVQSMSTSTGTAGTLKLYGCVMLNRNWQINNVINRFYPNSQSLTPWIMKSGEKISVYAIGDTASNQHIFVFNGVCDF